MDGVNITDRGRYRREGGVTNGQGWRGLSMGLILLARLGCDGIDPLPYLGGRYCVWKNNTASRGAVSNPQTKVKSKANSKRHTTAN